MSTKSPFILDSFDDNCVSVGPALGMPIFIPVTAGYFVYRAVKALKKEFSTNS